MATLAVVGRPTDHDTDDLDLVARVRDGDERAFELLFRRYQPSITRYVRGMVHDHGRAEDITQEVFISALRRMRETDREIVFKPWIYEIAKNACIDAFRRTRKSAEVSFDAHAEMNAVDQGPDSAVEGKVAIDNLRGAFGGLSQTHHEILVMREFEGLSYQEIGERLGISLSSVESTLFRARRRLSEEYDELRSGERCRRVQRLVDAGGTRAAGLRDQQRMARHLAHCQPCRRYAVLAGVDVEAPARRVARRIAGLLPLPFFTRRRPDDADDASRLIAGPQTSGHVAQWSSQVVVVLDPGAVSSWSKAIATAATVAFAGIGAGVALPPPHAGQAPSAQPAIVAAFSAVTGAAPDRVAPVSGVSSDDHSSPARRAVEADRAPSATHVGGGAAPAVPTQPAAPGAAPTTHLPTLPSGPVTLPASSGEADTSAAAPTRPRPLRDAIESLAPDRPAASTVPSTATSSAADTGSQAATQDGPLRRIVGGLLDAEGADAQVPPAAATGAATETATETATATTSGGTTAGAGTAASGPIGELVGSATSTVTATLTAATSAPASP